MNLLEELQQAVAAMKEVIVPLVGRAGEPIVLLDGYVHTPTDYSLDTDQRVANDAAEENKGVTVMKVLTYAVLNNRPIVDCLGDDLVRSLLSVDENEPITDAHFETATQSVIHNALFVLRAGGSEQRAEFPGDHDVEFHKIHIPAVQKAKAYPIWRRTVTASQVRAVVREVIVVFCNSDAEWKLRNAATRLHARGFTGVSVVMHFIAGIRTPQATEHASRLLEIFRSEVVTFKELVSWLLEDPNRYLYGFYDGNGLPKERGINNYINLIAALNLAVDLGPMSGYKGSFNSVKFTGDTLRLIEEIRPMLRCDGDIRWIIREARKMLEDVEKSVMSQQFEGMTISEDDPQNDPNNGEGFLSVDYLEHIETIMSNYLDNNNFKLQFLCDKEQILGLSEVDELNSTKLVVAGEFWWLSVENSVSTDDEDKEGSKEKKVKMDESGETDETYVGVFLCTSSGLNPKVSYTLRLIASCYNRNVERTVSSHVFDKNGYGCADLVLLSTLESDASVLCPNNKLLFEAEVTFLAVDGVEVIHPPKVKFCENIKAEPQNEAYLEGPPRDIVVVSKCGVEFACHKYILATNPVFRNVYLKNREAQTGRIVLRDMCADVVRVILSHIYDGSLKFDIAIAGDVLHAAETHDLPLLKRECEAYMSCSLKTDKFLDFLMVAELTNAKKLKQTCLSFWTKHGTEIMKTQCWETFVASKDPKSIVLVKHLYLELFSIISRRTNE